MPPLFDDALVSPELALVDPALAERARAALPPRRGRRVPAPTAPDAPPRSPPPRARLRVATPVLTLLATAAASLAVTAITDSERASGKPSGTIAAARGSAPAAAQHAPASSPVTVRSKASAVAGALPRPAHEAARGQVVGMTPTTPSVVPSAIGQDEPAAPRVTVSSAALVWDRATGATAYDVELRRGGTTIYSSTADQPRAMVPRAWTNEGTAFALQPEDQLYVWPVLDGRRSSPILDGVLAMDATRIARFVELGRRP
jgi:hypothetical protein